MKPYRVLDLCSGAAGGWSLGLHRAGLNTVAACETVGWRREAFGRNFPGARLYDDLRTLTGEQLRHDLGALPDFIVGSPPCKEYSAIGAGGGLDADDLFLHAVRLVGECGPRWVAFENSAFLKARGFDRIAAELEALGYAVWPFVVEARHAGARHERPRVFIVAADPSRPQGRPARFARADGYVAGGPGSGDARGAQVGRLGERRPDGSLEGRFGVPELVLGPAGAEPLGRHLRAYDGVPARLAEQCREAYGDALLPQLTQAVADAILTVDAELAGPAA